MSVLTISTANLRRLVGLAASDTSADAALALVVMSEQGAVEYGLDPTALASSDAGLLLVLTLGVSEVLAGTYLQQLARDPAPLVSAVVGALHLSAPTPAQWQALGDSLAKKGASRLAPFARAPFSVAVSGLEPLGTDGADSAPAYAAIGQGDVSDVGIWAGDTA